MDMDVATIVTVGVVIPNTMYAIRMDETVTAEIIAAIIGIVAGVVMTALAAAGMNAGVITIVTM